MMKFVEFKKMPRLYREVVITEKIDGTNAAVVWSFDDPDENTVATVPTEAGSMNLWCQSRNRFITPEADNFGFAAWCRDNATELARLGKGHHFGEWWGRGIQRGYGLVDRAFSLFNVLRWGVDDIFDELPRCVQLVPQLYNGVYSEKAVHEALERLREFGSYAAYKFPNPEGIVVHHIAANVSFKVTLENDDKPKGGKCA